MKTLLKIAGAYMSIMVSCTALPEDCQVLDVDTDNVEIVDLSTAPFFETVEFKSGYTIGHIDEAVISDTLALIKTSENLMGFDIRTGAMVAKYSHRGRASEEYLTVWSVGLDSGRVFLYDINSKKIMYFTASGDLIKQVKVPETSGDAPFQDFIRLDDDRYIGKRVYGAGEVPELSVYDSEFRYLHDAGSMILRSGAHFDNPFFRNGRGEVFYYRYLLNDIYLVDGQTVRPIYRIDFGRSNIPRSKDFRDEMQIIEFVNERPGRYATFVSNIYDSPACFCFVYLMDGERRYAVYDKNSDRVLSYSFRNADFVLSKVVTYNDKAHLFWQDMGGTVEMTVIPLEILLCQRISGTCQN